jgi:hypothetical protein
VRGALREETDVTRVVVPPPPATARTRAAPPSAALRRGTSRRLWPAAALAALLLVGGIVLAAALTGGDDAPVAKPATVKRTVTSEGRTVTVTATTEPATTAATTQATTQPTTTAPPPSGDAASLNDQGYRLMQAGDFQGALPLLEQAVAAAQGQGSLTEAYADYNLAFTRMQLGSCDGVLGLLDRSQQVQGKRKEIDRLRREAERSCGGE